jgi:hypothetical protein
MEVFLKRNPRFKVCQNFHEKGEGKCDLDRYFGAMSARERTFLMNEKDIEGMENSFFYN